MLTVIKDYDLGTILYDKSYELLRGDEDMDEYEYWEMVEYAGEQLTDYYGSASEFFPVAEAELIRVESMTPDEIIQRLSNKA